MIISLTIRISLLLLAASALLALAVSALGGILPAEPPMALPLGPAMNLDIYLIDPARGVFASITKNEYWDGEPKVSPDGRRVAFSSLMTGNGAIYLADLDTLQLHRLTNDMFFNGQPAWSPNGQLIVYASERNTGRNLYVIHADGSNPRRLTDTDGADFAPAWSPDGKWIAFSIAGTGDPGEIYVIDTDGKQLQPFTDYRGIDIHPAWSPDGKRLAFASDRDGSLNIYVMATDCLDTTSGCALENPRQLTRRSVNPATLWWSPDGRHILYWERVIGMPEIYALDTNCDVLPAVCAPKRLTNLGHSLALRGG